MLNAETLEGSVGTTATYDSSTSLPSATGTGSTAGSTNSQQNRRVHPNELIAALNAVETRHSVSLSETLPLDEALRELHIEADTEEIWREVEAARQRKQVAEAERKVELAARENMKRRKRVGWMVGTGCILATSLALCLLAVESGMWERSIAPKSVTPVVPPKPQIIVRTEPFFRMTPTTTTLGKLPNGATFPLEFGRLMELQHALYGWGRNISPIAMPPSMMTINSPLPTATVDDFLIDTAPVPSSNSQALWQVAKVDGKLYLEAWMWKKLPEDVLRSARVDFYNIPPGDPALGYEKVMTQIRIPFENIGSSYSSSGGALEAHSQFNVLGLDSHAWDKWTSQLPRPEAGATTAFGPGVSVGPGMVRYSTVSNGVPYQIVGSSGSVVRNPVMLQGTTRAAPPPAPAVGRRP